MKAAIRGEGDTNAGNSSSLLFVLINAGNWNSSNNVSEEEKPRGFWISNKLGSEFNVASVVVERAMNTAATSKMNVRVRPIVGADVDLWY